MPREKRPVLVCEDNRNISLLLKLFFERRGHRVFEAPDGEEAVILAQREHLHLDLIIMDIIMPGMDGIEACREIRRRDVETPIVILTSKNFAEDKERALQAGANAYLLKPFSTEELEAVVKPLLPP